MTREEAIAKFIDAAEPGSFRAASWIDRFVALGMLRLEPMPPKQTLWELLRKHEIAPDKAQAICNDAIIEGVSAPCDPVFFPPRTDAS